MAFSDVKTSILNLLKEKDCTSANDIDDRFNSYADLLELLYEFILGIRCDITYIDQILALIPDAELTSRGIYRNKTGDITNPRFITNSTLGTVSVSWGDSDVNTRVYIINSSVTNLNITDETNLLFLGIMSGSNISLLDVAAGCIVQRIVIASCPSLVTTLNKISADSAIQMFNKDSLSIFNGQYCAIIPPVL